MAFALLDLLVPATYLALSEYLLLFGIRSNEKENSNDLWRKGRRMGMWNGILQNVVYIYIFFFKFFSHSTLAICNKSHHSWVITEVLTEEILFHFWLLSMALRHHYFPMSFVSFGVFSHSFFSSVVAMMRDWCWVINFTSFFWGKKKTLQYELMVYFIDKSILHIVCKTLETFQHNGVGYANWWNAKAP